MKYPLSSWSFTKEVSEEFEKHVRQSVPLYDLIQSSIAHLSDYYVQKNGVVYDLGCATGETLLQIQNRHPDKHLNLIGVDNSPHMIEKSKEKLIQYPGVELVSSDIEDFQFSLKSNFILSILTLQFIPFADREEILKRVFDHLHEGGAFICVEKTTAGNPTTQNIFTHIHYEIKQESGLSYEEILLKEKLLRGVMTPISISENMSLLNRAGFETDIFLKHWQFTGFICTKPYRKSKEQLT